MGSELQTEKLAEVFAKEKWKNKNIRNFPVFTGISPNCLCALWNLLILERIYSLPVMSFFKLSSG